MFRLTVAYGRKGNLVLRIDRNGVALQKGLEFSPDAVKIYRMPFQTCLAQGCSALLVMADDLKQDLTKVQKGTITVYALNGQAVRAVTELNGFADGLAALDKRRGASRKPLIRLQARVPIVTTNALVRTQLQRCAR